MANLYSAAKTPRSHARRPPPLTPARPQHLLPRGARVIPTIAAQRASATAKTTTRGAALTASLYFAAACPAVDPVSRYLHLRFSQPSYHSAMGNLCGKESKGDNFAGPGRTLGAAPPPSDNARASIPATKKSPLQGNGRTLGGPGGSDNDPRSAAAKAAEVRLSFEPPPPKH